MSFENEVECSNPPIFARIGPSSGGYCIPVPPPSIPIITTSSSSSIPSSSPSSASFVNSNSR